MNNKDIEGLGIMWMIVGGAVMSSLAIDFSILHTGIAVFLLIGGQFIYGASGFK
jgi:hypothetical protein